MLTISSSLHLRSSSSDILFSCFLKYFRLAACKLNHVYANDLTCGNSASINGWNSSWKTKKIKFKSLYLIFEKFLRQRTHIFASILRIAKIFWLLAAIALLLLLIFQLLKWDNFFGFRLNHEFFGQTNWVVGCWLPIELHFCSTYYKYYSLHTHTHEHTHTRTHTHTLSLSPPHTHITNSTTHTR